MRAGKEPPGVVMMLGRGEKKNAEGLWLVVMEVR